MDGGRSTSSRSQLIQPSVWPVLVVVDHLLGQDLSEVPAAEDQHPVEALTTNLWVPKTSSKGLTLPVRIRG